MKSLVNIMLIGLAAIALSNTAIAGKKEVPKALEGTKIVTAEQVVDLIGDVDALVVVDARKVSDHQKGWIEGSHSLPNTDTTAETLAKLAPSKAGPVLFYCNGIKCGRSYKSAKKAIEYGYTNIYWFRGGMEEWEAKGLPMVKQ